MKHYNQLNFSDIPYGDGSIAENGCACCCLASAINKHPKEIAETWRDTYWDDDLGTLPEAFDNCGNDFNAEFVRIDSSVDFQNDDVIILLMPNAVYQVAPDDEGRWSPTGKHYECHKITTAGIERHDPRYDGFLYISPREAKDLIAAADVSWLYRLSA